MTLFPSMPCWYWFLITIFSLYYAIRGVVEQHSYYSAYSKNPQPNVYVRPLHVRIFVDYIQEFLFKVIITISSFIALFIANQIFAYIKLPGISNGGTIPINEIGAGTVLLLFSLLIWGILGACGYLTAYISALKIPGIKE